MTGDCFSAESSDTGLVLVTGAGSGIGAETCRALTQAGLRPFVTDVDAQAARRIGDEISAPWSALDVRSREQWRSIRQRLAETTSGLSGLILNAGLAGGGDAGCLDYERYRALFAVNVDGVFFGLETFGVDFSNQGHGFITITASMAGIIGFRDDPVYAMSKHALIGLVRSIDTDFASAGVRVQAVCPGLVDTPLLGTAKTQLDEVGYALITPRRIAEVLLECALGERTDLVTVVQEGREASGYRFAGVPGPATGEQGLPNQLLLGNRIDESKGSAYDGRE